MEKKYQLFALLESGIGGLIPPILRENSLQIYCLVRMFSRVVAPRTSLRFFKIKISVFSSFEKVIK